jgi:hypoxia up-regulated 1
VVLTALLLVVPQVLAVAAVVGIDLGTEYIKASLVKPGIPLEIVLTKDSRRKELSALTFKPPTNDPKPGSYPERAYGSDALAIAPRFPGDSFPNLKTLLGLPADSAEVKEYVSRHPALQLVADKTRGTAAFKSVRAFSPEEEAWLVEELLAMELRTIRENAETLAGPESPVRSAVLTIPPYFTAEERRAVELAADLAGLKVLSLLSDGLAVGLHYATSRQFPNVNEGGKPEVHMVFDMGAGSTKATVMRFQSRTVKDVGKFNKTVQEVQVLGVGWDRTLGGDALNYLIVDDMLTQFADSKAARAASIEIDAVRNHGRAIAKLTQQAERVRHVLSANSNTQTSIEGLYDDIDFKYAITRAYFEKMAAQHAERVAAAVERAVAAAGISIADLDSVILHGGASRTPFVQRALEKALGGADRIRTNVNSDEAAVFGAGFRAAELSPSFRVKEIRISEAAIYPAGMKWKTDDGKEKHQRLWTAASVLGGPAKEVTLANREDFSLTFYQEVAPGTEAETKKLETKNLTASVTELVDKHKCDRADIKLKLSARLAPENGEVDVTKLVLECEAEVVEKEGFVDGVKNLFGFGKKEQQPIKDDEASSEKAEESSTSSASESSSTGSASTSTSTSSSAATTATESADTKSSDPKKQLIVIPIKFTLEKAGIPTLSKAEVTALKDRLKAFDASDRARKQREEALNQLEAYTYKVRDLLEREDFIAHSTDAERADLSAKNSDASDWLYGDGAEASKEDLRVRLKLLQGIAEPVLRRIEEAEKRPELLKGLQEALNTTKEFLKDVKNKIAEYEAWHSSKSAAAAASSSTATESSSSTEATASASTESGESSATAEPSSSTSTGDFDGLEDDETTSSTPAASATPSTPPVLEDRGPVPPLYTLDDLKETEALYEAITAWLAEKLPEQEKLGPTDNPVILVKDLQERRDKLDKAGLALAMKGVKNYEKRKFKEDGVDQEEGTKKKTQSSKTKKAGKKTASATTATASAKKPAATVKLKPGQSKEEIDEMLKEFVKEAEEMKKQHEQQQQQQQEAGDGEKKEGHDEL